jgi:hypothetical protein
MHKIFYASGFIYHLPTEQILLQKLQSIVSPWILFEKTYIGDEQPGVIFKDNILEILCIKIDNIYPIYSYINETTKNNRSLFYATTKDLQEFLPKNGCVFRWFSFKEVLKIQTTEQTKHDIVVGQRVIEAAARKYRGEHTF